MTISFPEPSSVWTGEEDKRRGVTWPHHCEVPVIQRCDLGEPQTLGDGYYGGINDAKREIYIGLHELSHALDVLVFQFSDVKAVVAERF